MAQGVKKYEMRDTSGGICQFEELARPNQFADAKNVWAPDGIAETRPGLQIDSVLGVSNLSANCAFAGILPYSDIWATALSGGNAIVSSLGAFGPAPTINGDTIKLYNDTTNVISIVDGGNTWGNFPSGYVRFRLPRPGIVSSYSFDCRSVPAAGSGVAGTFGSWEYWNGTAWVAQTETSDIPKWKTGNELISDSYYWLRISMTQPYFALYNGITNHPAVSIDFYALSISGLEQAVYNNGVNYLYVGSNDGISTDVNAKKVGNSVGGDLAIVANPDKLCKPPSVAVLPEYNTAFLAYDGTVYECPLNSVPVVADIERREEIVYKINGIKSPYYDGRDGDVVSAPNQPGYVPQLTAFPQADYVLYHQGQLFYAKGHMLGWSAPAQDGAYKVFPSYAFEFISTSEDDSEISAIKAFQENIVVFKRRSVWLATYSGLNFLSLPMYKLQKVVSGVGCVSHDSCSYLGDGRLMFAAEDGFYAFNGATVQKLSRDLDDAYDEINPNSIYKMSGCTWRSKNYYLCAAPIGGDTTNSRVFAYDYIRDGWWLWDVPGQLVLNTAIDPTQIEKVISGRPNGVLAKYSGITDFGSTIPTMVETWRIADDGPVKQFRELRVNMDQVVNSITAEISVGDELPDPSTNTISFTSALEAKYGTAVYGTDNYRPVMRRERRLDIRRTGRWASLKLSSNIAAPTRYWNMSLTAVIEGDR